MDANELDYKMIGQRVRELRNKLSWPQAELAPAHVSHIENGKTKPALPTIVKIANALSVSVDDLLCDNLERVRPVFEKRIADELEDCSQAELEIFFDMIHSTKLSIRKNAKNLNL